MIRSVFISYPDNLQDMLYIVRVDFDDRPSLQDSFESLSDVFDWLFRLPIECDDF